MKQEDKELLEEMITGGLIGASLGLLISNNKGEGATVGAIIGAAALATYKAHLRALETEEPVYIEENGAIYEIKNGKKSFVQKIDKSNIPIPSRFKLK